MKIVITPNAQAQIDNQLAYSVARYGTRAAEKTAARIEHSFNEVIGIYPRTGTFFKKLDLYETVIPRTPFVVIYRIDDEISTVRILGFFHHAQDRSDFEPDA